MRWTIGTFGDMLWDHAPDLRPMIGKFLCERIEWCIDLEEELEVPQLAEIVTLVLGNLIDGIYEDRADPVLAAQLAEAVRAATRYDGPDRVDLHHDLQLFLMEQLEAGQGDAAMSKAHPAWPEIRRQFMDVRLSGKAWRPEDFPMTGIG